MLFRQITIKVPAEEHEVLERICKETSRTKTDILRTLIRSLKSIKKLNKVSSYDNNDIPMEII